MKVYNENTLINLSNSILKHFKAQTFHETNPIIDELLKGHKKVVAVLFDGMGQNILRMHLKEDSFIRKNYATTINSTYPPTTSAATISFLTGKYPIENGWFGWAEYFEDLKRNVILFKNYDYNTEEKLPQIDGKNIADKYFPLKKLFELIERDNKNAKAHGFFRYPIEEDGPRSLEHGLKQLKEFLSEDKECFAYFYWDAPDLNMHEFGIDSKEVKYEVDQANEFMEKVAKENPDTLFIVLADHGHINVKYLDICDHDDLYSLITRPLTLEKRTPGIYVRKGKEKEFEKLFNKYYSEYFELLSKEEVLKLKVFGEGEPAPGCDKVFGDYIAISKKEYCLVASKQCKQIYYARGNHAGGTEAERLIDISVINR